jgi:hypothetical protein
MGRFSIVYKNGPNGSGKTMLVKVRRDRVDGDAAEVGAMRLALPNRRMYIQSTKLQGLVEFLQEAAEPAANAGQVSILESVPGCWLSGGQWGDRPSTTNRSNCFRRGHLPLSWSRSAGSSWHGSRSSTWRQFNEFNLYEGGVSMLHIVNGDSVGDKLRKGNIRGDILVWREVYPVGPVFVETGDPDQRSARAEYLERTMGIPADDYVTQYHSQEQILQNFHKYDEIVLWFEHDLFDQLMLCYLLHWFSKRAIGHTQLNLLCIGNYPGVEMFRGLGQLTTKQLDTLSGTWRKIGQKELETGSRIWEAYASSDIERHIGILHEDTSALPFAHAAWELHVSRLPSIQNGLGIVEHTVLEQIQNGVNTPRELFKEIGNRLSLLGMGDLEFWYRLRSMSERPNALLKLRGSEPVPDYRKTATPAFDNSEIALTEAGMEVIAGIKDWVKMKGMAEWYGGLRLHSGLTWRWDPQRKQLVWC